MPTVVVFGGAGFIGTHLLKRLVRESNTNVVSVDIRMPARRVEGVDYRTGDVRDLSTFVIEDEIESIYNLAAVHTTPGHPTHEYYETNVAGATQITAFARRYGVEEIVFTSSISVYGPSEETKSEDTRPNPQSPYGWSKWLAETIHRAWLEESEARRLVIVRPAVTFGPGEGGNFARLAKLLKKGFFVYPGRTDTIKACFYVEDLLDAIAFARSQPDRYILFNGCYPDRYTIKEIVETLRQVHFHSARTYLFPKSLLLMLAALLRPLSASGLGIHPDRILKLIRSTDVVPAWLTQRGYSRSGVLVSAIERWRDGSDSQFD